MYGESRLGAHPAPLLLILVFRWLAFAWMALVAALSGQILDQVAWLAALVQLVVLCWLLWLTLAAVHRTAPVLIADLLLATGLLLVSGYVMPTGSVLAGHPSLTGVYPLAAVAAWAVSYDVAGGLAAGAVLALALPVSYEINGAPLDSLSFLQQFQLAGSALAFPLVGAAVGLADQQFTRLAAEAGRVSDHAGRLEERQSIAARIHDDVLQQLSRLRSQGAELAERGEVRPTELRALLSAIGEQERTLREMAVDGAAAPPGTSSLRAELVTLASGFPELDVQFICTDTVWLANTAVEDVRGAVREALTNVVRHARAERVWISVLPAQTGVTITVRDNGVGFTFDEQRLRTSGRLGLQLSVIARMARLGGSTVIRGRPGRGAEIELGLPASILSGPPSA
ncbi:hypothetical protein D5S17_24740 [Pseudonocardiaceae bacterium YIM PH 21723]|nr:hypothetical protein D5S17_24740 [Pseudonocardiaceae bacterium YIM PH 21723]